VGVEAQIGWVHSVDLEKNKDWDVVREADGILVPGGFGTRGTEGKILAARYARENKVPYLGLCLGMQVMVIEFARHVLGSEDANSTEFDRSTPHPVIDLLPEQRGIADMGGTMRLGLYPCRLVPGTVAAEAYATAEVSERHRHRFEFNNTCRESWADADGLLGLSPDGRLVEIAELQASFMLGSQFIPNFSRDRTGPTRCSAACSRRRPPMPIGLRPRERSSKRARKRTESVLPQAPGARDSVVRLQPGGISKRTAPRLELRGSAQIEERSHRF
jgi:CTP synthase